MSPFPDPVRRVAEAPRPGSVAARPPEPRGWRDAWWDALAFVLGLGLAWYFRWKTGDLVWSLWLSSLVVGYAMILWNVSAPLRELLGNMASDPSRGEAPLVGKALVISLAAGGTVFGLLFFTVHFGGFHFVHSVFLNAFFPVLEARSGELVDFAVYAEVFERYWWFLPSALLAERHAFRPMPGVTDLSVKPEGIAQRKAVGDAMFAPYRNVIRMHLLIFFFAFAHFVKLENFLVYAAVYAVYLFPWRLLRRSGKATPP